MRIATIGRRLHILLGLLVAVGASAAELPNWALGPFERPDNAQPVIRPDATSTFDCPMRKAKVRWEALHTFNPTAVLMRGKISLLYRAEDDNGEMQIGGHTSRLGLATSDDGIRFARRDKPVFFPANDSQSKNEWPGGCEDPRIATAPDGSFVMTYTQWNRKNVRLGLASSRDLVHWEKLGTAFRGTSYGNLGTKSASVVHEVKDGKLVAAKIDGKFWMYFGEAQVNVATSEDLLHWTPLEAEPGRLRALIQPRKGRFDSVLTEVGPQAVKTGAGIVLIYNGKNATNDDRDPALRGEVYSCGQVLFDAKDPTRVIERLDTPFFKPELDWERSGQYAAGTTFAEGLVYREGKWFLYYGCADSFVGAATADAHRVSKIEE
jgi:predicted GH43/DUF377 family glycosyl hydrolase